MWNDWNDWNDWNEDMNQKKEIRVSLDEMQISATQSGQDQLRQTSVVVEHRAGYVRTRTRILQGNNQAKVTTSMLA